MQTTTHLLWQFNLELSLLLMLILTLRWALKRGAKIYNSYWLWLVLPLTPIANKLASSVLPESDKTAITNQLSSMSMFISPDHRSALLMQSLEEPSTINTLSTPDTDIILFLWVAGVLFFLARLWGQHCRLRREMTSDDFQIDIDLQANYPVLGVQKEGFSPSVYGFFKPRIYFPTSLFKELDASQCNLILQHEEQHIRHGHLWLNLFWDILACVVWFNPLIYIARRCFRHDQELLCDYLVLKNYDEPEQRAYGHALISTVSATHSVNQLCSWKMFNHLEERIMSIKSKQPVFKKLTLTGGIFTLLALSSVYTVATADSDKNNNATTSQANNIKIINLDSNGRKRIKIETNGKAYLLENDQRYIITDGQRHELTQEQQNLFTDLLEKNERYTKATTSTDKGGIFDQEHVFVYSYDSDKDFDLEKIEKQIEAAHKKRLSTEKAKSTIVFMKDRGNIEDRISQALKRAENSDDVAINKARKTLLQTHKKLKLKRVQIEKQQKQALKKFEELNKLARQG